MQLALRRTHFRGINVHEADPRLGEAATLRRVLHARRQATGPVPEEAAVQRTPGELRELLAQAAQDIVEGEQRPATELDHRCLLQRAQRSAVHVVRAHGRILSRGAVPPLEHRLRIQPVPGGHDPGRVFRRLELGSNSRRRAGATVEYASHTASSASRLKDAPRLPGTTHLVAARPTSALSGSRDYLRVIASWSAVGNF